MPTEAFAYPVKSALLQDWCGYIWIGAGSGLYSVRRDRKIERYTENSGLPDSFVTSLIRDQQRRIWAGTGRGL
jgi:ligand-binding sensor domain-containing protein